MRMRSVKNDRNIFFIGFENFVLVNCPTIRFRIKYFERSRFRVSVATASDDENVSVRFNDSAIFSRHVQIRQTAPTRRRYILHDRNFLGLALDTSKLTWDNSIFCW